MYVVGNSVTFTITRPKESSPVSITSGSQLVRATDPQGNVSNIPVTASAPTSSATGSVSWGDTLSSKGIWRYEILDDTGVVVHVLHVNAVDSSSTYTSTVKF